MNYSPVGYARSNSTRSRRQSLSYNSHNNGGYLPEQAAYYSEPLRNAQIYPEGMSYRQPSMGIHAPMYDGGELSRYPSRRSYGEDSRDSDYYDPNDQLGYDYQDYPSTPNKLSRRHRRRSTFGSGSRGSTPFLDNFRGRPSVLKFKLKGGYHSGVTLAEAMDNVRLSGDKTYSHRDLSVDSRGNLYMKIVWSGYTPLTYEIPVDGYDGRMSLQTLMRRVARACLHYVQARAIPMHPDRIILHSLEEVSPGTWQPVMTVQ